MDVPFEVLNILAHPEWTSFSSKCDGSSYICHLLSSLTETSSSDMVSFHLPREHVYIRRADGSQYFWACS
ncbi:hypothetical protein Y032_0002g1097 [Ancylostoma ceylanicum]|uniref:Uncharacterized protein n=1 Tax=Ancylostoma ceylanicum TaxID=53326 RepID=A0A016VZE8_9BILA|nr:hypothetical protein Y032_0002g1097 [Ancylostoma ceylanicum]